MLNQLEIFQEDDYAGSSAPSGYTGFSDIEQSGKGKGAVAMTSLLMLLKITLSF